MIYNSSEAGVLIKVMAPLIPVMYLDHVVDGMLKGMGEQLYSMKVNIFDAAMSVVLVYIMVPLHGVYGYVVVIFMMEIINASLSIVKLFRCCNAEVRIFKWLLKPLVSVIGATSLTRFLSLYGILSSGNTVLSICICMIIYAALLVGTFSVTTGDIKWFKLSVR